MRTIMMQGQFGAWKVWEWAEGAERAEPIATLANEADAAQLVATIRGQTDTIPALETEYGAWVKAEGLPEADARELAASDLVTNKQAFWLTAFAQRWDIAREVQDALIAKYLDGTLPGVKVAAMAPGFVCYDCTVADGTDEEPCFTVEAVDSADSANDGLIAEYASLADALAAHPSLKEVA